jgi:ribonuclease BN (tRNA processing enzyme)
MHPNHSDHYNEGRSESSALGRAGIAPAFRVPARRALSTLARQIVGLTALWAASLTGALADDTPAPPCGTTGLALQVLGSGGPELTDRRASTGYLVWRDGRAGILIDLGPGSLLRFEQSGARVEDLELVLLTHLHVDHAADLPALIKASFFTSRDTDLPVYGPTGNQIMPGTDAFVRALFAAPDGAFHYLNSFLDGGAAYRLRPHEVAADGREPQAVIDDGRWKITAVPVHHGPLPALAWRVDVRGEKAGRALVVSGDMNGDNRTLVRLAADADLLVAHHAIPEGTTGVARNLHMPPSVIGTIAADAGVKRLVLSHRMTRTLGRETESEALIREHYKGPLDFAEDGQCFPIE